MYGSRVVFQRNYKKLDTLKKNKILDILYGRVSFKKNSFLIPKYGFNKFFDDIEKKLKSAGVKIFKDVSLKSDRKQKSFYFNNKNLNYDYLIWTANPVPLLQTYDKKIDNKFLKVKIYFSKIKRIKKLIHTYINVYSLKSKIFRIYIYNQNKHSKISIEVFSDKNNDPEQVLNQAKKILKKAQVNVNFVGKLIEQNEVRHIFLTKNDIKIFKKFKREKPKNLIDGLWDLSLNRDQKLLFFENYVERHLKH